MEFNEKLQELRKQKGLTQEELAEALYISRAAVSKWESGRGYPNLDSLKAISKFFHVSIDALLSGDELLTLAEEDGKHRTEDFRTLVFGLIDLSTILFLFLPLFAHRTGSAAEAVSLMGLTDAASYLKALYLAFTAASALWGLCTLALQSWQPFFRGKTGTGVSLLLSVTGVLLMIVSLQPYAAALLFVFLLMKGLLLLKKS